MTLSYDDAVAAVKARQSHGFKPGRERVLALLDALADPHLGYPIVRVVGTNGKTSTARMVAALIGAQGLKAGAFTSPQLEVVEDQFLFGTTAMRPKDFAAVAGEVVSIADVVADRTGDPATEFEVLTALACSWFADRAVDVAVMEAGLGGRDDSTNVGRSEVTVLTGVSLDHTGILGDTVEAIAEHKVGILDEGATLVAGHLESPVAEVAERLVSDRDARLLRYGIDFGTEDVRFVDPGWVFDVEGVHERYTDIGTRLRGRHQVHNLAIAIAATEALLGRAVDEGAIREVAATITVPGRMELVREDPPTLVDGAHNPGGMAALVAALREEHPTTRWTLVFGAMTDKDVAGMLAALEPIVLSVVSTASSSTRAGAPEAIAAEVRESLRVPVVVAPSVLDALTIAGGPGTPILVTGSIALVGEARRALRASSE
ncbi:MAG TPA: Mur ligase family protein [Acidimicrobiia bacterium]|nr:Mur ligase family protein [Acidimicrobiia bacterium]